jgi:L-threonylcarbamoyladenylate synthase
MLLRIDRNDPDPTAIERAAALIREGRLVAFPTETVYGLGANALDPAAVARIFEAKGRPSWNPLIVHVDGVDAARRLTTAWPQAATVLGGGSWPGPVTLVLPKAGDVPDLVTAGLDTVAVRVPAHPVALALVRAAGVPIAAPSANRFTELSPTRAEHVAKSLGGRVDMILDGGKTDVGIESAVVDLSTDPPRLLRPGAVGIDELRRFLPALEAAPASHLDGEARPSPGMLERHYAPRGELRSFPPGDQARLRDEVRRAADAGRKSGALLLREYSAVPIDEPVVMPAEAAGYAAALYEVLHALDDAGCDVILVEELPATGEWVAVRDRLRRAMGSAPGR